MATLKQRQKAELKALNLECEQRLQGKKGDERAAELKVIEGLKRALADKHERELQEEEERQQALADTGEEGENGASATTTTEINHANGEDGGESAKPEKKISRARLRQMKKDAKEEEEKKKRQEEAAKKGPTKRDLEMNAILGLLSKLGLQVSEIPPDGNCLYGAVAHQLRLRDGRTLSINELRTMAAAEMKNHPAMFAPFLPEGETLEQHCKTVMTPGEWGGELEIRALSMALRKQIWVHRLNSPTVKMGEDEGFEPSGALHLTFHEYQFALGEHYNSAVPVSTVKKDDF